MLPVYYVTHLIGLYLFKAPLYTHTKGVDMCPGCFYIAYNALSLLPSVWQLTAGVESGTPVGVRLSYVESFDPGIAKQHFMALTL